MARQQRDQIIKEHIMAIHHSRPFYGYPRITVALKKEGFCVNHKRVYRLMREMNIHSIIRKSVVILEERHRLSCQTGLTENFKPISLISYM
ncbi:transposase [Bacillus subtilis]|nr:transposase [Bacillus subtilis]